MISFQGVNNKINIAHVFDLATNVALKDIKRTSIFHRRITYMLSAI